MNYTEYKRTLTVQVTVSDEYYNSASSTYSITIVAYNGGSTNDDISSGVSIESFSRYVSIVVDGVGMVSANIRFTSGGILQAGLFDQNGTLLWFLTADASNGGILQIQEIRVVQ